MKLRWAEVTPTAAAEGRKKRAERTSALPARTLAAKVQLEKLRLAPAHRDALLELYGPDAQQAPVDEQYTADDAQQTAASALLCEHLLDIDSRELYDSKWRLQWAVKNEKGTHAADPVVRMLVQCACGYHHGERASKTRRVPLPYTGCLAHAELTYFETSKRVVRVRGYFEHNTECRAAKVTGIPIVPVHREVYEQALKQLALGATLADVLEQNRALCASGGYSTQPRDPDARLKSKYRWHLKPEDSRALYRQYHRVHGVLVREKPQINVDDWLDPSSSKFKKELHDAVCHYKARAEVGDRFEIIISTDEMKAAAWKYSHQQQILLDGTFGICDSKMLLFIVMGLDEERHGTPLAFLLFSAPEENKKTCAGYDTEVLKRLLERWSVALGTQNGQSFEPLIAITDTDARERAALLHVWPKIWLILCLFHLLQSWGNHRKKALQGKTPILATYRDRLRRLERDLIASTDYSAALALVAAERTAMKQLPSSAASPAGKAVEHLDYLANYWMTEPMWQSWSTFGRRRAANILKCDVHAVLTTTNHLEGFNRVLKRKHLHRWQRNGRRLRIDVLISVLALHVVPAIFAQRRHERKQRALADAKILLLPGGEHLLAQRRSAHHQTQSTFAGPVAFLTPDPQRDAAARELVELRQIATPQMDIHFERLIFPCYSSLALDGESNPTRYTVNLHVSGLADCSCPDFEHRGGACKHIRAALLKLDELRQSPPFDRIPTVTLPASAEEARRLCAAVAAEAAQSVAMSEPADVAQAVESINKLLDAQDDAEVYDDSNPADPVQAAQELAADSESESDEGDHDDDSDVFDVVSCYDSRAALDHQAVMRVVTDFRRSAPKLGDLAEFLSLVQTRPDTHADALRDARACVSELLTQIDRVLALPEQAPPTRPQSPKSVTPPLPPSQPAADLPKRPFADVSNTAVGLERAKRQRTDKSHLLAPPSEKAQKRKDSHSYH